MTASSTCLQVIEASHRLDRNNLAWLRGIAEAAHRPLGGGRGVAAFFFATSAQGMLETREHVLVDTPEAVLSAVRSFHNSLPPDAVSRIFQPSVVCATLREMGVELDPFTRSLGFNDVLGLQVTDANGLGCSFLFTPERRQRAMDRRVRRQWMGVAQHIRTALRLRNRLSDADLWSRVEAVLEPDGRIVHAEGEARSVDAQQMLQRFCRAIDQARTRQGKDQAEEDAAAAHAWPFLIAGRWSLIEDFESDGRRYFIAVRNPPEATSVSELTKRERQVADLVMHGHSNKYVALELGLSEATVKTYLRSVMTKLLLHSRTTLVALGQRVHVHQLSLGEDEILLMTSHDNIDEILETLGLTQAEKEVAHGIIEGHSNLDIARKRGTHERTIANQVQSLFRKLGVHSRAELVAERGHNEPTPPINQ